MLILLIIVPGIDIILFHWLFFGLNCQIAPEIISRVKKSIAYVDIKCCDKLIGLFIDNSDNYMT